LLYLSSLALSPSAAANRRIGLLKFKPEITPLSIPTNFAPLPEDAPQVTLVEDDDVIQAFAADRTNEALDIWILPW
jgi:hypothetical protein